MMGFMHRFSIVLIALLSLTPFVAGAQTPVASPGNEATTIGTLAEFSLKELPTPHAEVWFLRFGLDPGGSLPLDTMIGPAFIYVESGSLTLTFDGPVVTAEGQEIETPGETTLRAAESLHVPEGTSISASNPSSEPVRFLVLLMYAAEKESQESSSTAEPVGLSQEALSIGTAEFMPAPATVTIERVQAQPGETLESGRMTKEHPGPGWMGMDLGLVESGSAQLMVERQEMDAILWPNLNERMPQPQRLVLSGTYDVQKGTAYAAYDMSLTWTVTGAEPLTILRVIIAPAFPE